MNEMVYYVGGYWRRRPAQRKRPHSHEYSAMHNRLVEEVEFLESLRLQGELAEAIEQELERM
jgi:hypothetical protein